MADVGLSQPAQQAVTDKPLRSAMAIQHAARQQCVAGCGHANFAGEMSGGADVLNHAGKLIVSSAESPWLKIADFVEGRNEDVLLSLGEVEEFQVIDLESEDDVPKKNQARSPAKSKKIAAPEKEKTTLAPAAAWPFPTSSRT